MRLAVLADSHGNLPALEAVLQDIRKQGVDDVVVAGDFTGGPQPQETLDLLRSLGGWMIRGNAEEYVLAWYSGEAPAAWREGKQWATLRWSCQRLDRGAVDFVARLSEQQVLAMDGMLPVRVVHGSPNSPFEFLIPNHDPITMDRFRWAGLLSSYYKPVEMKKALAQVEEPVLVCAHSHIPWVHEAEDRLVLNVGSVGAPNDGDPRAQYALLTWEGGRWHAMQRAVPYDLDLVRAAFCDTGYLTAGGEMARAFLLGIVKAQNIPGRFAAHLRRLAAKGGHRAEESESDGLWERAVATFDWGTQPYGEIQQLQTEAITPTTLAPGGTTADRLT